MVGLQEDLGVGQRVRQFGVDTWDGSAWTTVANDTTVGSKKLVRLPAPVTTTRVRIRITSARSSPAIASVGLFSRSGGGGTGGEPVLSGLSGKCLDGGSATRGAPAQLWDCNGSAGQRWTVPGNGTLQVDGRCLDITGNRTANGTAVEVWDCNGGANQQWQASGGALVNPRSGRCLDDPAFNRTNGTQLVIWDCNGGANQRWTLP